MAELAGLPIPTMDWHSPDAPQAFKKFKARCELYFSGPLKEKSEEEQISYLAFLLIYHHPAQSYLRLVDILLITLAPVYSSWLIKATVSHTLFTLWMWMVQPF